MRSIYYPLFVLFSLFTAGCITRFTPETDENQELVVVEGLITDQPGPYTVKISKSVPLGTQTRINPLPGCTVTVSDDSGNSFPLTESEPGVYVTDSSSFTGTTGRKYVLHFLTNDASSGQYSYESAPVEMKPVPAIDSLYYEKVTIAGPEKDKGPEEGCNIYLDTHDPENLCKFYRWDYVETWEFVIPFYVKNRTCWINSKSEVINIKSTNTLELDRIERFPLKHISNETDRLSVRYSIIVNQYSLNEEEFHYWEKLKDVTEDVGSLYDMTPSTLQGNMVCIENPAEKVLGYFSVSSVKSRRIFIRDLFKGLTDLYNGCISDTIYGNAQIPNLNVLNWIIEDNPFGRPPYRIITTHKGCADCTTRGSTVEPPFWKEEKNKILK